jgi:hypothetical protein
MQKQVLVYIRIGEYDFTVMSTRSDKEAREGRWIMIFGFIFLGLVVALAIWLAFTMPATDNWPPPSYD